MVVKPAVARLLSQSSLMVGFSGHDSQQDNAKDVHQSGECCCCTQSHMLRTSLGAAAVADATLGPQRDAEPWLAVNLPHYSSGLVTADRLPRVPAVVRRCGTLLVRQSAAAAAPLSMEVGCPSMTHWRTDRRPAGDGRLYRIPPLPGCRAATGRETIYR